MGFREVKYRRKKTSLSSVKNPFTDKKESSAIYSPRGQSRAEHRLTVSAVMIPRPAAAPQRNNQQRMERPQRQFTRINMTLTEVLPHLLRSNLATLNEAPKNPNTTSPRYNPNARCSYHSESPGHDMNDCWALRNKVQDLIEAKEIEFDAPEKPNVITAPMHKHNGGVNVVDTDQFVT